MWRKDGNVVQYLYFVDQAGTYGDDALWNLDGTAEQKQFVPGQWHRVVTRVVLNSVTTEGAGDKNGIVQSWFDGELSLDLDTLRLRDSTNQRIDEFYLSTFHGGNDTTWAPTKDVFVRYDNFVVSTDSIAVTSAKSNASGEESSAGESDIESIKTLQSGRSGEQVEYGDRVTRSHRNGLHNDVNSVFLKNDKTYNLIGQQQ